MAVLHLKHLVGTLMLAIFSANPIRAAKMQPNFIVIQPDDFYFFEEWNPPAQFDGGDSLKQFPRNSNGLPNINRIRGDGVEMMSAYAASTMCGTSRYSTITGRYPSRSSYGRSYDGDSTIRDVSIPRTKLDDTRGVNDPNDCSENNIASLLQSNGYRTGVVGKWHLTSDDGGTYSYSRIQNDIKECGFDFAEAIYKENLWGSWNTHNMEHNMEHVTSEAIRFIQDAAEEEARPFFLYFNPTVPHDSGDVTDALQYADCRDTVGGRLSRNPDIPYGMTADYDGDCRAYRQSVLDRGGRSDDKLAGAVWVDDAIGSLFQTLERLDAIDNTFILFQLDHGEDRKGSLFEGGSRIVQFVHYPDLISSGSHFRGLVSTIDVAATIADIAGVPENNRYAMDGKSWMSEVANDDEKWDVLNDRCLIVEEGLDRSIRCGCYKYILVVDRNNGRTAREARKGGISIRSDNFYYLCDQNTGKYINAPEDSPEIRSADISDWEKSELIDRLECHLERTTPSSDPDYSRKCDGPLDVSSHHNSPTKIPTKRPTMRPSNEIVTDDDTFSFFLDSISPWTDSVDPSRNTPSNQKTKAPVTPQPISVSPNPTANPSRRPTINPTPSPTSLPTSKSPTTSPTPIPSLRPQTSQPSSNPSFLQPTNRPTYDIKPLPISSHTQIELNITASESFDFSNSTEFDFETFCADDLEYLYYGRDGQDCQWVIQNDRCDREDPKTKLHVGKIHCPDSCSYCLNDDDCSDNPYFQWYGQEGYGCAWLVDNDRCDRLRDSGDGTAVHVGEQYCPESCGYCPISGNETKSTDPL